MQVVLTRTASIVAKRIKLTLDYRADICNNNSLAFVDNSVKLSISEVHLHDIHCSDWQKWFKSIFATNIIILIDMHNCLNLSCRLTALTRQMWVITVFFIHGSNNDVWYININYTLKWIICHLFWHSWKIFKLKSKFNNYLSRSNLLELPQPTINIFSFGLMYLLIIPFKFSYRWYQSKGSGSLKKSVYR